MLKKLISRFNARIFFLKITHTGWQFIMFKLFLTITFDTVTQLKKIFKKNNLITK